MNPYNKMKKHAVEVGNQQKLQTLGEVNSGKRILAKTGVFSVHYLSFLSSESESQMSAPDAVNIARMRSVAICDLYKIQNFLFVSYAF